MGRVDTVRAKELRRSILQVLRAAQGGGYEGWLSERAVWSLLKDDLDDLTLAELRDHITYLAGKGYLDLRTRRETKFERSERDARLLPKGVDLLEATVEPDPGIEDDRV
jgi:hypothetical protein